MALISVIIPCYNSELYVGKAIESILKQSFRDFEIIIVDNNSTDATVAIAQSYVQANPDLITLLHESKPGAPFARNRGLLAASGQWLQFLDSDDEILPEKLAHQFQLAKKSQQTDLVVGSFYEVRQTDEGISKKIVPVLPGHPWKGLIKSSLGKTSSMLWKREAVLAAGGWNEQLTSSQEYDLLFRMLQNDVKIEYCELPETIHHVVANSISRSENNDRMAQILDNYVNLRMGIKNYLEQKGKYTRELSDAVNMSIYFKLLPYKKRIPDYVEKKLKEVHPKVPVQYMFLHRARRLKGNVKKFIKQAFF